MFCFLRCLFLLAACAVLSGCFKPGLRPNSTGSPAQVGMRNGLYDRKKSGRKMTKEEQNTFSGADMHNGVGLEEFNKKNFTAAAQRFHLALRLVPDYIDARNNLGRTYYMLGKFGAAMDAYKKALTLAQAIEPDNTVLFASIHANIGDVHRQREDWPQAVREYQEVLALAPRLPRAHYEVADLYLKQGKAQDAKWHFSKTLELDARYDKALLGRAIAHQVLGDYQGAKRDVMKLEERGWDVSESLKKSILEGIRRKRNEASFQPAY